MSAGRSRHGGRAEVDAATQRLGGVEGHDPRQTSLLDQMSPPAPAREVRSAGKARPVASSAARDDRLHDHRHGHRERLRERLRSGGADAMPDYELLELVLFRAIPRQDTKALAKDLIARFGNLAEVIAAPDVQLDDIDGVGERVKDELKLMRAMLHRLARRQVQDRHLLKSWDTVIAYLETVQAHEHKEAFRILFLDKRNQLIADEVQQRGTVDHTPVYVREVIARTLELGATAIILVHNHPSGDPSPSNADIDMTKAIMAAGRPLGIAVHDHIIVGRKGHVSLRGRGLM